MTGGSPDEGWRSTARMATLRPPTWILREPRIGPVVTLSSVRAGASPIGLSFSLRRYEPGQVRWVRHCCTDLSCAPAAPQGRVALKPEEAASSTCPPRPESPVG